MSTSTITYLEQTSPNGVRPAKEPRQPVDVRLVEEVSPEFARFLYASVGGDWYWTEKLSWTWDRWIAWLTRPAFETWVAYAGGVPAGYIALKAEGTEVEVENFGLLPGFIGRGIGGHLLTVGLRSAWSFPQRHPEIDQVTRVWLHTNTLDGPNALGNYEARGLRRYKTEKEERPEADGPPPGPWPGAAKPPAAS
ncbi:GCN5-related N-acetyltransferase [Kribbella flavida DSM 17836]|uniref:GCN5-related N-acetyltransferase n=1 Tax=Kribbella flavida (strain DSM 17836 / JCM 10339 / NBRC 14399) TaxID=479435 RepID=D2PXA8_KRIFD|nr:GNAT family N-acetyltransferase [Kribbella flavida]ADB29756.1 GCN5-related N-acetyltransferase [Kribbella flavida DSM 17836]